MRRIREILRLRHEAGLLSGHAIAPAPGVSNSTVAGVFARCAPAGLARPLPEGSCDGEREERLCLHVDATQVRTDCLEALERT